MADIEAPDVIYTVETDPDMEPPTTIDVTPERGAELVSRGLIYLREVTHVFAPMPGVDPEIVEGELC